MNTSFILRKTVRLARTEGFTVVVGAVVGVLRRSFRKASDSFDLVHGTKTAKEVSLWQLNIGSANVTDGVKYQTADLKIVDAAFGMIPRDIDFEAFTFLDLGCGKGRPLILASQRGFKHLVGVDFSEELIACARTNLKRAGVTEARLVCADAAEFKFPDTPLVIYMYNPFSGHVMEAVKKNLETSWRANPRPVFVLYINPQCAETFDGSPWLRRLPSAPHAELAAWQATDIALVTNTR